MIKIFTGDDRVKAKEEIVKFLGEDYEVLDGPEINLDDIPSIFMGASFLASERKILIRDLAANKATFEKLVDYLGTPHKVALLETKLDKRGSAYKALASKVEIHEFNLPKADFRKVFEIYRVAKTDGKRAVKLLEEIKSSEEPIPFTGLLVSQALKDFTARPSDARARRTLKDLAELDLQEKSTGVDPWILIEAFLLRLSR